MIQAKPARRPCSVPVRSLPVLFLVFTAGGAFAASICNYDNIAATAPASRFTDNGDGTVTDQATRLQWKRCSEGQTWSGGTCTGRLISYRWQQALQHADTAIDAGKSDWRLPNIKELTSIVEEACIRPAIDLSVFPAAPDDGYWSSSPAAAIPDKAWRTNFYYGDIQPYGKGYDSRVRLVRGGQ